MTTLASGEVLFWNADTHRQLGESRARHHAAAVSAAFSADGKKIVTASLDGTARLWDGITGEPISEPLGGKYKLRSAKFSPDGKSIVTAGWELRVWEVPPDVETRVAQGKTIAPRCLTPQQREQFFLPPKPPEWCIELEKWPYDTAEWKQWLTDTRFGKNPALPSVR